MKTFLTLGVFAAIWTGILWDANPPAEGVTNYVVHGGAASRSYTTNWNAGTNTSSPIPTNVAGFYAVTAEGDVGTSGYSGEIFFVPSPGLSRVKLRIYSRDFTTGLWSEFARIPLPGTNAGEMFQLRISP